MKNLRYILAALVVLAASFSASAERWREIAYPLAIAVPAANDTALALNDSFLVISGGRVYGLAVSNDVAPVDAALRLFVYEDDANTTAPLVRFHANASSGTVNQRVLEAVQDYASATADVQLIQNDGTGSGLYIQQNGVLASGYNGLWVYSNAAQVTEPLAYVFNDNASSTEPALEVRSDGDAPSLYQRDNPSGDVVMTRRTISSSGFGAWYHYEWEVFLPGVGAAEDTIRVDLANAQDVAWDMEATAIYGSGNIAKTFIRNGVAQNEVVTNRTISDVGSAHFTITGPTWNAASDDLDFVTSAGAAGQGNFYVRLCLSTMDAGASVSIVSP